MRLPLLFLLYLIVATIWSIPVVMGDCRPDEVTCGAAKALEIRTMLVGLLGGGALVVWIRRSFADDLTFASFLIFLLPIIPFIMSVLLSSIVYGN
jgi:hypothetical protein